MMSPVPQYALLAIDDETEVLEMIRDHFSLRGFEVHTAGDGREGILLCEKIRPDAILLDLKMKDLDGDKALVQLRALVPDAKVFVISGYQDELAQKRIGGLPVTAYFEKPVSILELEKAVRRALTDGSSSFSHCQLLG